MRPLGRFRACLSRDVSRRDSPLWSAPRLIRSVHSIKTHYRRVLRHSRLFKKVQVHQGYVDRAGDLRQHTTSLGQRACLRGDNQIRCTF
jgi:hypothetical protein